MRIRVAHLYPDYLNIYADRGNIAVFERRAALRGHDLEITSVAVSGGEGPPEGRPLSNHEPVEVRIHYVAYSDVGRAHVSAFVRRADGLACCMARSSLDGVGLDIRRGHGTVAVRFERLPLVTGRYIVEAYFLNDSDSLVLTPQCGQSDWFTVAGRAISSTDHSGVFEPTAEWVHRTEPDDGRLRSPEASTA